MHYPRFTFRLCSLAAYTDALDQCSPPWVSVLSLNPVGCKVFSPSSSSSFSFSPSSLSLPALFSSLPSLSTPFLYTHSFPLFLFAVSFYHVLFFLLFLPLILFFFSSFFFFLSVCSLSVLFVLPTSFVLLRLLLF